MTETPAAPGRVALHYTGTVDTTLAGSANAEPAIIRPDTVVVVDQWAADVLIKGDAFKPAAGASLDAALRAAGLPTTGTADEKRDRLTAHAAALTTTPTDEQETDRG